MGTWVTFVIVGRATTDFGQAQTSAMVDVYQDVLPSFFAQRNFEGLAYGQGVAHVSFQGQGLRGTVAVGQSNDGFVGLADIRLEEHNLFH